MGLIEYCMFDAIINLFRGKRQIDTPRVYEAIDVARFIINYGNEHDMFINNFKLQKLLYFIQLQFLINDHKRPCFKDNIEVCQFGVVIPNVYREYKNYRTLGIPPVKTYWDLSKGLWNAEKKKYVTEITSEDQETIIDVIIECDKYSNPGLLSVIKKQSPWMLANNTKGKVISIDSMIDFINQYIKN